MDYTVGMKGADFRNQLAQSYLATLKKVKWYMKIFFNQSDIAVVNSLAIHKVFGSKMAQTEFKTELVQGLLQKGSAEVDEPPSPAPAACHLTQVRGHSHLQVKVVCLLLGKGEEERNQNLVHFRVYHTTQCVP